ncbi:unnamed protein product, partial [Heterotrigona itama]
DFRISDSPRAIGKEPTSNQIPRLMPPLDNRSRKGHQTCVPPQPLWCTANRPSVNVPATVKADDTDYVILDCDYDLENTPSKGLVVKWFFNTNEVAYQWIYGREPLAGDTARKYIDLEYKASDDPYTKYRAMKLNKPGIDLTGEYTCVIFTFADEQSASASMVVY